MKRVEKFRQIRRRKRVYFLTFISCCFMVAVGTCIVDYSFNDILRGEKAFHIITFKNLNDSYFEINIMNNQILLNTRYVHKDMEKLNQILIKAFQRE